MAESTAPAAVTNYKRTGTETYIVGSGPKGLLYIPDIFGHHPNTLKIADMLAAKGFLVVIPDFFNNEPWDLKDLPPSDPAKFGAFMARVEYDKVKPAVLRGLAILRALGATTIGSVGFCWGGKITLTAMADEELGIKSGASPHPSRFTAELARAVKGPFCLMPTKDDTELLEVRDALNEHPWAAKNVYRYFEDMHHGFCGARVKWDSEANVARVDEAIAMLADFFNNTL